MLCVNGDLKYPEIISKEVRKNEPSSDQVLQRIRQENRTGSGRRTGR